MSLVAKPRITSPFEYMSLPCQPQSLYACTLDCWQAGYSVWQSFFMAVWLRMSFPYLLQKHNWEHKEVVLGIVWPNRKKESPGQRLYCVEEAEKERKRIIKGAADRQNWIVDCWPGRCATVATTTTTVRKRPNGKPPRKSACECRVNPQ